MKICGRIIKIDASFVNSKGHQQQYISIYSVEENRVRTLTLFDDNVEKIKKYSSNEIVCFEVYRRDVFTKTKKQRWINVVALGLMAG